MSIKNFKNPWAEGGEYYPDWLGGEKVLGANSYSQDANEPRKVDKNSKYFANCIDYPAKKWWVEWFDREGHTIYVDSRKYGFSINGSLFVIAHAFREQVTTLAGRNRGYKTHNWWNIGPVASRIPPQEAGDGGWATFSNIHESVNAYIDRITSPADLNAYKNPNHNPSFPEIGLLLKNEILPTPKQVNDGFRIGTGNFVFCAGADCNKYGEEILRILDKYVHQYFIDFLNFKIDCIKNKTLSKTETELAKSELEYYRRIINQIEQRPK